MRVLGIIPARFESTRFPGKALVDIQGKTMVQRVYEQASKAKGLSKVLVATDDARIFDHISEIKGNVCMTSVKHPSGTDRCREAMELEGDNFEFVVNIQGDEPFINPAQIDELTDCLNPNIQIATQVKLIEDNDELVDSNCVKVLIDSSGNALYFSRNTIPYQRNVAINDWVNSFDYYQHIGIYAYRNDILKEITKIPPSSLEIAERLEQLRWLENGYSIRVLKTSFKAQGIDTPQDLDQGLSSHN